MVKLVWKEDGFTKTARGYLEKVDNDLIYFQGERGLLIIGRSALISIK